MKKVILYFSFVVMAALLSNVNAQIPNLDKHGCIWNTGVQGESHCVGCGQKFEDGSGFCQKPNGCPKCWDLVYDHWDETLGEDIYKLTIDPDDVNPTIIYVYNVNLVSEPNGWKITYTEI